MHYKQPFTRRRLLSKFLGAATDSPDRNHRSNAFQQTIRPVPPVHPAYWSFTLAGLVETPLILSYEDTLALPAVDVPCTLLCNGGSQINTASWRGIPLQTLLDPLNIHPAARYAQFLAADGYMTGISLEKLSQAMLVYAVNDKILSHEQGFPARLIVPGLYGYKMPKWITRIELTDIPVTGFWEQRGWSASGSVEPTAILHSPRHRESLNGATTLRGTAYAGECGISRIEISIDDGPWMPVPFTLGRPFCETEWQITWQPPAPGEYLIRVRAADSRGNAQRGDSVRATVVHIVNT